MAPRAEIFPKATKFVVVVKNPFTSTNNYRICLMTNQNVPKDAWRKRRR